MRTAPILRAGVTGAAIWSLAAAQPALADQVVADDLIVQGSVCMGVTCVNGEGFVAESLRLKGPVNRIRVVDNSTTGTSVGYRDWIIDFNEDNGPGDFMSFADNGNAGELYRRIMVLRAGAPSSSIYVDPLGRVGLGTATPATTLHISSSDTARVRLEQNGSSGFPPQTWDILSNEAGLYVGDITHDEIPFLISTNAPSNSLTISSAGRVRVGTSSSDA